MSFRKVFVGMLAVGILGAQEPKPQVQPAQSQPEQVQSDFIIRGGVTNVLAPVVVYDKNNNIVNGLTVLDFQLFDNGKLQTITEDVASHPISMVVAVQASANMEQLLPNIRKTGSLFSQLVLGNNGEISVVAFDHRIQMMTDFTSDPDKISDAFKRIKAGSTSSYLNDTAMDSINRLTRRDKTRRKILLLISETRDNGSAMKVRDVLTKAEFESVSVYAVEVSHFLTSITSHAEPSRPNPVPPEARPLPAGTIGTLTTDAQGQVCCSASMGDFTPIFKEIFVAAKAIFISNPQEVYTKYTGGKEYSYKTQKGLENAIADIGEEIHSSYLLSYSPNNKEEAGYHEIEVRVLGKQGLTIRTRPGYWAAAQFKQ